MEDKGGQQPPPPPQVPSPLTGCYLLVVVGEPHSQDHKEIILQKISKGLLSWDVKDCLVDLEKELISLTEQNLEGEEARYGERLIQFASENLVTEILIHPAVSTLSQCVRNLLSSFTRHRHIIHAGYTFHGNGSWALQDGTFSYADFAEAFQELEVQRVIHAYENGISIDLHCAAEGDWTKLPKEGFAKICRVRLNPTDVLTTGSPSVSKFTKYLDQFLTPTVLEDILESSDVVGNIRFSRPTLYVFPGGQGDAALFGINGFNMLLDGGYSRKACFWDFVRHLDRLDAILMSRLNNSNVSGISSVIKRKKQGALYPQIGHFFCNIQERKSLLSPDGDKDKDPLIINLLDEGHNIIQDLNLLNLTPQTCYRDPNPIILYHKVGHGTLNMFVLSPDKNSKEVREFLQKWHQSDIKLFSGSKFGRDFTFPLQNLTSICALLIWQPANPNDTITRILYPGSAPQKLIFDGLDRLKAVEYMKQPVCTVKSFVSVKKPNKQDVLEKLAIKASIADKKTQNKGLIEELKLKNAEMNGDIRNLQENKKFVKKSEEKDKNKVEKSEENGNNEKPKILKQKQVERKGKPSEDGTAKRKPIDKKGPPTPKKTVENKKFDEIKEKKSIRKDSPGSTPAKSTKDENNRKVVESKRQPQKRDTSQFKASSVESKVKSERKPISRPPKVTKGPASPMKKIPNGNVKSDHIFKRGKLDKEGTTDSSTVSTPSADQESILKKDISALTPEELQLLKDKELDELKEEQEAVKEIEAVFRKGEKETATAEEPAGVRKVKEIPISTTVEDQLETEEYLVVEKEEIEHESLEQEGKDEEEMRKLTKDSEESEKNKRPIEKTSQTEVQKLTSPEDNKESSPDNKKDEEIKEVVESHPDEKVSGNVESGATTTAPTLPEDERITLNDIKEDKFIQEKHVKEETKEKDIPIIQLSMPIAQQESHSKPPPQVSIPLEKQKPMRDLVKTPDEVADLPVHEEVDYREDFHGEDKKDEAKKTIDVKEEKKTDVLEKAEVETREKPDQDNNLKKLEFNEEEVAAEVVNGETQDSESELNGYGVRKEDEIQEVIEKDKEDIKALIEEADKRPMELQMGDKDKIQAIKASKHEIAAMDNKLDNLKQEVEVPIEAIQMTSTDLSKPDPPANPNLGKELKEISKFQEKLDELKDEVKVKLSNQSPEHAESVILPDSSPEEDKPVGIFRKLEDIDKAELGRKSPAEREEDVKKIVAGVAEVLKSEAPLEELGYSVTRELRETHITTQDSTIPSESLIHAIPEESSLDDKDPTKLDDSSVHRMLVTASSEDGGEEIEICPAGSITFSRSSESSGRSSPEGTQKTTQSQKSSISDIASTTKLISEVAATSPKVGLNEDVTKKTVEDSPNKIEIYSNENKEVDTSEKPKAERRQSLLEKTEEFLEKSEEVFEDVLTSIGSKAHEILNGISKTESDLEANKITKNKQEEESKIHQDNETSEELPQGRRRSSLLESAEEFLRRSEKTLESMLTAVEGAAESVFHDIQSEKQKDQANIVDKVDTKELEKGKEMKSGDSHHIADDSVSKIENRTKNEIKGDDKLQQENEKKEEVCSLINVQEKKDEERIEDIFNPDGHIFRKDEKHIGQEFKDSDKSKEELDRDLNPNDKDIKIDQVTIKNEEKGTETIVDPLQKDYEDLTNISKETSLEKCPKPEDKGFQLDEETLKKEEKQIEEETDHVKKDYDDLRRLSKDIAFEKGPKPEDKGFHLDEETLKKEEKQIEEEAAHVKEDYDDLRRLSKDIAFEKCSKPEEKGFHLDEETLKKEEKQIQEEADHVKKDYDDLRRLSKDVSFEKCPKPEDKGFHLDEETLKKEEKQIQEEADHVKKDYDDIRRLSKDISFEKCPKPEEKGFKLDEETRKQEEKQLEKEAAHVKEDYDDLRRLSKDVSFEKCSKPDDKDFKLDVETLKKEEKQIEEEAAHVKEDYDDLRRLSKDIAFEKCSKPEEKGFHLDEETRKQEEKQIQEEAAHVKEDYDDLRRLSKDVSFEKCSKPDDKDFKLDVETLKKEEKQIEEEAAHVKEDSDNLRRLSKDVSFEKCSKPEDKDFKLDVETLKKEEKQIEEEAAHVKEDYDDLRRLSKDIAFEKCSKPEEKGFHLDEETLKKEEKQIEEEADHVKEDYDDLRRLSKDVSFEKCPKPEDKGFHLNEETLKKEEKQIQEEADHVKKDYDDIRRLSKDISFEKCPKPEEKGFKLDEETRKQEEKQIEEEAAHVKEDYDDLRRLSKDVSFEKCSKPDDKDFKLDVETLKKEEKQIEEEAAHVKEDYDDLRRLSKDIAFEKCSKPEEKGFHLDQETLKKEEKQIQEEANHVKKDYDDLRRLSKDVSFEKCSKPDDKDFKLDEETLKKEEKQIQEEADHVKKDYNDLRRLSQDISFEKCSKPEEKAFKVDEETLKKEEKQIEEEADHVKEDYDDLRRLSKDVSFEKCPKPEDKGFHLDEETLKKEEKQIEEEADHVKKDYDDLRRLSKDIAFEKCSKPEEKAFKLDEETLNKEEKQIEEEADHVKKDYDDLRRLSKDIAFEKGLKSEDKGFKLDEETLKKDEKQLEKVEDSRMSGATEVNQISDIATVEKRKSSGEFSSDEEILKKQHHLENVPHDLRKSYEDLTKITDTSAFDKSKEENKLDEELMKKEAKPEKLPEPIINKYEVSEDIKLKEEKKQLDSDLTNLEKELKNSKKWEKDDNFIAKPDEKDSLNVQHPELKKLSISDVDITLKTDFDHKNETQCFLDNEKFVIGKDVQVASSTEKITKSPKDPLPSTKIDNPLSEPTDTDDDEDLSTKSQVAHSQSDLDDTEPKMTTSMFLPQPDEDSSELPSTYLYEITKAKFTTVSGDESEICQVIEGASGSTIDDPTYLYEITKAKFTSDHEEVDVMTGSFIGELPTARQQEDPMTTSVYFEETSDPIASWGKPLGLPSPAPPTNGTPKKEKKVSSYVLANNKLNDDKRRAESPSLKFKSRKLNPIYVDLTYIPHQGNHYYTFVEFFKRIRARYYVFSGLEPSRQVFEALLEAKQTWENKDLEVTIIPTYDTDTLGYWVVENEELLSKFKIDLAPSASRCTINLQDHETSCSAYRLEF
ncbi:hypothetical protein ABEB36_003170 [Hypothenemus hampei]|uniref:Microtubule-associated protein futsch n=1 Tax=Hypothenemus hampei TaxID=57062 RepID=A0ABD1FAW6_HYPHA